jgi:hypothetical protein
MLVIKLLFTYPIILFKSEWTIDKKTSSRCCIPFYLLLFFCTGFNTSWEEDNSFTVCSSSSHWDTPIIQCTKLPMCKYKHCGFYQCIATSIELFLVWFVNYIITFLGKKVPCLDWIFMPSNCSMSTDFFPCKWTVGVLCMGPIWKRGHNIWSFNVRSGCQPFHWGARQS